MHTCTCTCRYRYALTDHAHGLLDGFLEGLPMAITSPTAIAAGSYQRDREAKAKATLRTWRHAAAQLGGHLAELGQVPARNLDHAAIQRRLEAGRRGLVDAVADGDQVLAQAQLHIQTPIHPSISIPRTQAVGRHGMVWSGGRRGADGPWWQGMPADIPWPWKPGPRSGTGAR